MTQILYQITCPVRSEVVIRKSSDPLIRKDSSGYFTRYFKNSGQKESEGKLRYGLMIDVWRFYHRNGQLKCEAEYENGLNVRTRCSFYETGEKESLFDEKNLVYTEWYRSGKLKSVTQYIKGCQEASSIEWFETGRVKYEYFYYQHHEHGIYKEYQNDGELLSVSVYHEPGYRTPANRQALFGNGLKFGN